MDTKRVLITLSVCLIALAGFARADELCPTYTCGPLPDGQCSFKNSTATPLSFVLQECKSGEFCPTQNDNQTCSPLPTAQYYPGSRCTADSDCLSGKCTDTRVCERKSQGEVCEKSENCNLGLSCMKNGTEETLVCLPQLGQNSTCQTDFDCQNAYGCFNNTCTSYFSLAEGQSSTNLNMCQSGYQLEGVCRSLNLVGGPKSKMHS